MLNILIVIFFVAAIYEGIRNGVLNELISLVIVILGFWMSFVLSGRVSRFFEVLIPYPSPASKDVFTLYGEEYAFSLDRSFYMLVAFIAVFLVFFILAQVLLYIIEPLKRFEENPWVDTIGGAVISFAVAYFILFLILFSLSTIPAAAIQSFFENNLFARLVVKHTPILSRVFFNEFVAPAI